MLLSEGFVMAKVLSNKMTVLFKLLKEQMSKQDHYDYGLRNTKSILVAAGSESEQSQICQRIYCCTEL